MAGLLGNALSDIGAGIEQADPGLAQVARSQDLGSALKNAASYVGGSIAQLPGEAVNFSPVGQVVGAAQAFHPSMTPTERALALAGVGLGILGGATAWSAAHGTLREAFTPNESGMIRLPGMTENYEPAVDLSRVSAIQGAAHDPYEIAKVLSTTDNEAHHAALSGFVNGLGNRLGDINTWGQIAQDAEPGTAGPMRAGFTLAQFQALLDQQYRGRPLAGKSLSPYVDTYNELRADAPKLLSTQAGQQRVQAFQDFLHRMSEESVDWVPHPSWQVSPSWRLTRVEDLGPNQKIGFEFKNAYQPTWAELNEPGGAPLARGLANLNHLALEPQFAQNMDRVLQLANDDDWRSGTGFTKAERYARGGPDPSKTWYGRANADAGRISDETGVPKDNAAAVISVLSSGEDWDQNVEKAIQLIRGIQNGMSDKDIQRAGWAASAVQYNKVKMLVEGSASPVDTFVNHPKAPENAQKTLNFFYSIMHPGNTDAYTSDRHNASMMYGFDIGNARPPMDNPVNYEAMARAGNRVALANQLTNDEAQAVTWAAWIRLKTEWNNGPRSGWGLKRGPYVLDPTVLDALVGRDPTLGATIRQMPKDNLPAAIPWRVEPDVGSGLEIHHSVDGVRIQGDVSDRARAVLRVLHPASDPAVHDLGAPAPFVPVLPRPVGNFGDHMRALFSAHDSQPAAFDVFADPSAPTHPSIIPGSHLLAQADLKDEGALNALYAHLRDHVGLDMSNAQRISGPVRYEASAPPYDVPADAFREVGPGVFSKAITAARKVVKSNGRAVGETVYQYPQSEYAGMKTFLSPDGKTGYAVKPDGDLVSVFNVGEKGKGEDAVKHALTQGASKLDAFDENGRLPDLYGKYGFTETGRDEWNPEYAPPGWKGGTPDVVYMERQGDGYKADPTPRRSLMIHLGDAPDRQLVQGVWDAVRQVSAETGKQIDPVYYGMSQDGPEGARPAAEHLFSSKEGTMVHRSDAMDVRSPNSVPVWVPEDAVLPTGENRLHAAMTVPEYTPIRGPKGETVASLADNAVRVQYTHLQPVGTSQRVDLAKNITASRVYGKTPKFFAVSMPSDPAKVPAVSLGVESVDQADGGLKELRPKGSEVMHFQMDRGNLVVLDAPNELFLRRGVALMRRLGATAPVRVTDESQFGAAV